MEFITGPLSRHRAEVLESALIWGWLHHSSEASALGASEEVWLRLKMSGLLNNNRGLNPSNWKEIPALDAVLPLSDRGNPILNPELL
jgi:hypothetical protein